MNHRHSIILSYNLPNRFLNWKWILFNFVNERTIGRRITSSVIG
jgi:hypothetical protein